MPAHVNVQPIRDLVEALNGWADAIEAGEADDARFRADHLKRVAQLLSIDPEFKRIFFDNKHACESHDAEAALECFAAFLHAVADAIRPGRFRPSARTV